AAHAVSPRASVTWFRPTARRFASAESARRSYERREDLLGPAEGPVSRGRRPEARGRIRSFEPDAGPAPGEGDHQHGRRGGPQGRPYAGDRRRGPPDDHGPE